MTKIRIKKHILTKYGKETYDKVISGELQVFRNNKPITNLKDTRVDSDEEYLTFKTPKTAKTPNTPKTSAGSAKPKTSKTPKTSADSAKPKSKPKSKPKPESKPKPSLPPTTTVREYLMRTVDTAVEVGRIEAKAARATVGGEFVQLSDSIYFKDDEIVNSEGKVLKFKVVRNSSAG